MKYSFDSPVNRRGTNSYKWDSAEEEDVLPLWVADMDFKTAPAIVEALQERVSHGIFGYTKVPESYYESVIRWFDRRHHWRMQREWMMYTSGVVPALSATIKALTHPGDGVLVMTPVYNCFFSSIRNNGCRIESVPLVYGEQTYRIDWQRLEEAAAKEHVRVLLLCNPHNPACRVWTREELQRIGEICLMHGLRVIADEIHCELVMPGHRYTPFASVDERLRPWTVTCVSPSKAFNLAGLQIATIVCTDKEIRSKIDRAINDNEVCDVNPFGVIATQAAYNEGEDWLQELITYLHENYLFMVEYCKEYLPEFPVAKLEGTYLAWMDCRALNLSSEVLEERLLKECKLWLNAGSMYGAEGDGFMRWNLACPRSRLTEALERFRGFIGSITRP